MNKSRSNRGRTRNQTGWRVLRNDSWSELWAFPSERAQRLFEEIVPVPARKNSLRWIETYAGFEDESKLLLEVFHRIFTDGDREDRVSQFDIEQVWEEPKINNTRIGHYEKMADSNPD